MTIFKETIYVNESENRSSTNILPLVNMILLFAAPDPNPQPSNPYTGDPEGQARARVKQKAQQRCRQPSGRAHEKPLARYPVNLATQ